MKRQMSCAAGQLSKILFSGLQFTVQYCTSKTVLYSTVLYCTVLVIQWFTSHLTLVQALCLRY